jgi:hypothetical protein
MLLSAVHNMKVEQKSRDSNSGRLVYAVASSWPAAAMVDRSRCNCGELGIDGKMEIFGSFNVVAAA